MGKQIKVHLKDRSYEVIIDRNILGDIGKYVKGKQVIIISDPLVYKLYGNKLKLKGKNVSKILIPRGEKNKNLKSAQKIWNRMASLKISRDATLIALGGGVIGDLTGFVASTYMRGTNLIQVPTTLLAQVDAAIGGKTGIDHPYCKNMIGTFYQPDLVYIDVQTLKTLPQKEIKNGLAEIVKYGVIKSTRIMELLENNSTFSWPLWEELIALSVEIKSEVVGRDEREVKGVRMILNFGHTFGHAIETLTKYQKIAHGEAVSIGMIAAGEVAYKMRLITAEGLERIWNIIRSLGLPTYVRKIKPEKIIKVMEMDKKVRSGKLKLVLPIKIGKVEVRDDVPKNLIYESLKEFICK